MEWSFHSPPSKRSISYFSATGMLDPTYLNGSSTKRTKFPPPPPPPPSTTTSSSSSIPPGHVCFRLLCHASRVGGVIGKSGSVIRLLQQETSCRIRVEEAPSESPDRVITVTGTKLSMRILGLSGGNGGGVGEEAEVTIAQEGLIRVFERVLHVAAEADGVGPMGVVSCRLLTESIQAGSVIGKGGKHVEKIRKESGCKIRILAADKLQGVAGPNDELVEIEGDVLAVKKALLAVSCRLQDCPPSDKTKIIGNSTLEAERSETLPEMRVDLRIPQRSLLPAISSSSVNYSSAGLGRPFSIEPERVPTMDTKGPQDEVIFRVLCSNERAGGVIGKGGTIIRALQNETGASITIGASVAECDERLITISATENTESRYSPAQNAVVLVFSRSVEAGIEKGLHPGSKNGAPVTVRLAVPSNQVGCLLGKGGSIISEMRKITGASIHILGSEEVPKCATGNDQVVQITGEFVKVQDALYHVTGRLRDNLSSHKTLHDATTRGRSSVINEISPYSRVRDHSPIGLHPSVGVSHSHNRVRDHSPIGFHPSVGVSHSHSRPTTVTQSRDYLGLPHNLGRPRSPRSWESQTVDEVNLRGLADVGRGYTSMRGGLELGSGSRSAIVTNTTVEIAVPENVVGSVYGVNGGNLTRLRQISGAKVILHEPRPGTRDRIVVISGTPDETQAAQSLLQAFILTGSS